MIVDRKLQLSVKKTTRQQKTLDGNLSIRSRQTGEETTISSRVAELDNLIPQYLGVSKAILDSVIFCHQDDSLWPMSAPSLLKKKFDEIFEAQKYTKAIENIKVIRKKKQDDLKIMINEEKYADEKKKHAVIAERKMEALYAAIGELTEKYEAAGAEMRDAIEKSNEAWNHHSKFEKILSELRSKQIQEESLAHSVDTISMNMKKMDESDQELHRMQSEHENDVASLNQKKKALTARWTSLSQDMTRNRHALGQKQAEVGAAKNASQQHERHLEARKGLIAETASKFQIRGYGLDITDEQVAEFSDRLARLARDQQITCDDARQRNQNEVAEAQQSLNELIGQQSNLTHTKSNAKAQLDSNDKRLSVLHRQIQAINCDETKKNMLEESAIELDKKCKAAKDEFQAADWNSQIKTAESKIAALNDMKERLDSEQAEAAQHAAELGQLTYLNQELGDRRKFLDANIQSNDQDFRKLFKEAWTIDGLEQKYRAVLTEKDEAVKEAEIRRDALQREVAQHESKLRDATSTHVAKKKKHDDIMTSFKNDLDMQNPSTYLSDLEGLEMEVEQINVDEQLNDALKEFYTNAEKYARDGHGCRMCERPFKDKTEQSTVVSRLQAKRAKQLEEVDKAHAEAVKGELSDMRDARPRYEAWLSLSTEIPELAQSLVDLKERRDHANTKLESADEEVRQLASARRDVEALSKAVQTLVKCNQEIASFKSQLQKIEQKQESFGGVRATEVIQEEIRNANVELRSITATLNQHRLSRERMQSNISRLELDHRDAKASLSQAENALKQKAALESQITEYKSQNDEARDAVKQADQELQSLIPKISQSRGRVEDISQRGNERESELQKELVRIKDSIGRLELQNRSIDDYLNRGGPGALAKGTREMEAIETEIRDLEVTIKQVQHDTQAADEELRTHDDRQRKISDNLTFRSNSKRLTTLREEIAKLEATNAAADQARYAREGEKWQIIRNELAAKQASYSGEIRTKDDQFKEVQESWEADYKNAKTEFKKAHITTEVTKCVIEDLGRYAGALDKAIMKYHGVKMEEINRIIQDLWRKTYRGSDVDTIMIRSENENQKGNKSYNYRVVMVKQDAEMDMRGRCSAGQKVLASIIIRLALAECFSVNSGLIALDEPTTNLDRDNIRSLAQSLAELIKVRRKQANFQLIIITHDEEFLRHMNCAELCDEYFRVSRNEKQKSQITKQSINEVYR